MSRILYIACEVLPGVPELHGGHLVDVLAQTSEVRVVGAVVPDCHEYVGNEHFGAALVEERDLSGFDAIVIEEGWKQAGGSLDRLRISALTAFLRAGGQVIVADVGLNEAGKFRSELADLTRAVGMGPVYDDHENVINLRDDLDRFNAGSEGERISGFDPQQMRVTDWLSDAWRGVESVLAAMPVQIFGARSHLATGTGSTELETGGSPADGVPRPVWAGVVDYGLGHFALIGAGVTDDYWIGLSPGNAAWIANLVDVMCNRTRVRAARLHSGSSAKATASTEASASKSSARTSEVTRDSLGTPESQGGPPART